MKRSRTILASMALGLAVFATACGGGDDDGDAAPSATTSKPAAASAVSDDDTITVDAKEFAFEPKELQLEAGEATTIVLKNTGAVEHDFTVDDPSFKLAAVPTKTAEGDLTIPTAGSYTFYCSVPGHRAAGMEGTVTVS